MPKWPETPLQSAARAAMLAPPQEESQIDVAQERIFAWANALEAFKKEQGDALLFAAPNTHLSTACESAALREDEIGESLPVALVLQNAKSTHANFIALPGGWDQEGKS